MLNPYDLQSEKKLVGWKYEYNNEIESYISSIAGATKDSFIDFEQYIIEFVSDTLIRRSELFQDASTNYIRIYLYEKIK